MPSLTQRNGTAGDGDSLILTPSKLRLHSYVFGPYITCLWLPNAILAALVLLKASKVVHSCLTILCSGGCLTVGAKRFCAAADWIRHATAVVVGVPSSMDRPCRPCMSGYVCAGISGE